MNARRCTEYEYGFYNTIYCLASYMKSCHWSNVICTCFLNGCILTSWSSREPESLNQIWTNGSLFRTECQLQRLTECLCIFFFLSRFASNHSKTMYVYNSYGEVEGSLVGQVSLHAPPFILKPCCWAAHTSRLCPYFIKGKTRSICAEKSAEGRA